MVSKTDDIPASVPNCNPVDLADETGDGAQEASKTRLKDSCACGESADTDCFIYAVMTPNIQTTHSYHVKRP